MFPIKSSDAYIKENGERSTIGTELDNGGGGGGGSDLPEYGISDAGKVLTVGEDGELEWDTKGGGGGVYSGVNAPASSLGEDGDFYLKYTTNLVPTITSPSSSIIAGQNSNTAYKVFDGDDTTYWSTADRDYTDMYIGYDFGSGETRLCDGVKIMPRQWNNVVQLHTFKVQGSNDLENWVDIYTGEIINDPANAGIWNVFTFENSVAYRALRILATDINTSQTFTIYGLQFMGDGAKICEAVYIKVNGSWVNAIGYELP